MFSHLFTITLLIATLTIHSVTSQCLSENDDNSLVTKSVRKNLYQGQQAFTVTLLDAINKATPNENIFFSPYSTYHALLLAYFGAKNNTEIQLKNALKLDWANNKQEVYGGYAFEKQMRLVRDQDSKIEFSTADKIFVSTKTPLRPCMENLFYDELENKDFASNPEQCLKDINQFIENATKHELKNVLQQGDITSETKLAIANAAYFKGQWQSKFNQEDTKKQIFYTKSDKQKFVNMMHQKGTFNLAISEKLGAHVVELPYISGESGTEISMVIFLPPFVENGLETVLSKLTPETLHEALNDSDAREIEISLPKFSFEQRIELVPVLNNIGVTDLFTSKANLTGFSEVGGFSFDDAKHVAKIKVDEEGSTAAATTVFFSFRSARPLEPTKFICDHPFLFLIFDHKSDAILFAGIYRDPE